MKKYTLTSFLILTGTVAYLSAMEEGIQVELAKNAMSTVSYYEFEAFKEIIDADLKKEFDDQGSCRATEVFDYLLPSAGQAGFDFIIKNVNVFKKNDTEAINAALEGLYTSKDSTTFASMLEIAHYLDIKSILQSTAEYINKNIFDMIKNNPTFLEAILKMQKKYKQIKFFTIDIQDKREKTALMRAAQHNHEEIVSLLIAAGAKVNIQAPDVDRERSDGITALMMAVTMGSSKEIVEKLLEAGADPTIGSLYYGSALYLTKDKSKIEELILKSAVNHIIQNIPEYESKSQQILIDKLDEFYKEHNYTKFIAFVWAATHKKIFELGVCSLSSQLTDDILKGYSYSPNEDKENGILRTKEQIKRGKQINEMIKRKKNYLLKFFTKFKNFLENHGKNIKDYSAYANSTLVDASKAGNKEIVTFLLDAGADIHSSDYSGNTLLAVAAKNGNKEMVEFLLDKGADPNKRGIKEMCCIGMDGEEDYVYGDLPLELADKKKIREMLIDAGAKEFRP